MRLPGPSSDRAHLARAVAVAERARQVSSPNPAVGCVLVRDGQIVGEAATSAVGGPHAEVNALVEAGERARGATAYVTLEPCAHHGRTPPCTDALGEAGVRRVVYGLPDPDPVAAGGAARLREGGVDVEGGLLRDWVACQLEGWLTAVTSGRPHVTLKLAQTVDGRLVVGDGPDRTWITGPAARTAVHGWRAAVDAVLVGSGTVLADDPRLDVRHAALRGRQPRVVVLDSRLRTSASARVARPGTVVLTEADPDPGRRDALRDRGVDVRPVAARDGRLDLEAALRHLVELGITSVLAEPGATLANALVDAGVVDRLASHVALDGVEGDVQLPVGAPPGATWAVERRGGAGPDLILHLTPRSSWRDEEH